MELLISKIYGPRRLHIRSIDIGRYRHNYEGFCEKFIYPKFISKEKMTTTQGAHASLVRIFLLSSLSLLVKSFEEEVQSSSDCVDTIIC